MTVMKFGGTSLANVALIDRALDIVTRALESGVVLVASAIGATTDGLQAVADAAGRGDHAAAQAEVVAIRERHTTAIDAAITGAARTTCHRSLDELFAELDPIVTGLALLKQWTPRSNDAILGFGERLSTLIIAARARERGVDTRLVDSRTLIRTDDHFMQAAVDLDETARLIRDGANPEAGTLVVAQGFIAATAEGHQTTLGRGGSDYTATLFGAALEATEVVIWTDVDGVMTCDPRLISEARTLSQISYHEAAELAYFGARVVHPATIQPAVSSSIPVAVRNAAAPQRGGTRIVADAPSAGPKAIAFKRGITLINVTSSRMLLAYGFLRRIFEIFENHRTPVDLVATSEVSVSVTIDNPQALQRIVSDLEEIGATSVDTGVTIVAVVGQELWEQPTFLPTAVAALQGVPLKMMCLGASDVNLSLVVPDSATEQAVRSLHRSFFEGAA